MDATSHDDLCWDIVTTIAAERDVDPMEIDERLYDVIDVDSLERLAHQASESEKIDLSVSFQMAECFVTVTGDETVRATCPN
jgi:hypothetical protein